MAAATGEFYLHLSWRLVGAQQREEILRHCNPIPMLRDLRINSKPRPANLASGSLGMTHFCERFFVFPFLLSHFLRAALALPLESSPCSRWASLSTKKEHRNQQLVPGAAQEKMKRISAGPVPSVRLTHSRSLAGHSQGRDHGVMNKFPHVGCTSRGVTGCADKSWQMLVGICESS